MEETRRVRFTDDYVPGPEGCPVWMIQKQWTYSYTVYVRAKNEDEAFDEYMKYYEEHEQEINDPNNRDSYVDENTYVYYHAGPEYGWKR